MDDKIFVILTFDIDNDPISYNPISAKIDNPLDWNGVEVGIPSIVSKISDCAISNGAEIKTTWFIRCDNQLKEIYGDEGYLLDEYRNIWNSLRSDDAEIAWHAHLYKKNQMSWIQETDDNILKMNLGLGYKKMVNKKFVPISARIGESYMSNEIMSTLDGFGIKIESTSMPGRVRKDEKFSIDWNETPPHPYFPSKDNYRKPGNNSLKILEVPMSMISTKVEYDKKSFLRYVNLSFHNSVIKKGLRDYIKNNKLLVSITHPFEVTPSINAQNKKHPLISFNPEEFSNNINFIIAESEKAKKECIFIRLKDVLDGSVYEYIMKEHK